MALGVAVLGALGGALLAFWPTAGASAVGEPVASGARGTSTAAATVAAGGDALAPAVGVRERAVVPPSLRLVTRSGVTVPDGAVELRVGEGADVRVIAATLLDSEVVAPVDLPVGPAVVASAAEPPTFADVATELQSGGCDVVVVPVGRLRLRCVDLAGHATSRHRHGLELRAIAATTVERSSRGRARDGAAVTRALREADSAALQDGGVVPVDASVCVFAAARSVVRIEPPHGSWYGVGFETDGSVGARAPTVGGARSPVSAPIAGAPGEVVEVRVVLAEPGAIEVRLDGWPTGATGVTVRREGLAGVDGASNSWSIAAERQLDARGGDEVRFVDLVPGRYRVDAACRSGREVTCALLVTRVEAGGTAVVVLADGTGPHEVRLRRDAGRSSGQLLLAMSPPRPPGGDSRRPPHTPALTVTLPFRDWEPGESLTIRGLWQTRGTAHWFDRGTMPRVEFDLARGVSWALQ